MDFTKSLRNSRYRVKDTKLVRLIVETNQGQILKLEILDCSLTGVYCRLETTVEQEAFDAIQDDAIIPVAKIIVDHDEFSLGRLSVRRKSVTAGKQELALSTIDVKIPIDGPMSRYLEISPSTSKSPFEMELPSKGFNLASFISSDLTNADIFERCNKFSVFFEDWKKSDRFAYLFPRTGMSGPRVTLEKTRPDDRSDFLMFGSNDYLGLSSNPRVIDAAIDGLRKYGVGSTGTAPTAGTSDLHNELSYEIAKFYGKEDALVYSSGYSTNVGVVSGLAREQDLLIGDMLAHASIQDGMNLSRGTSRFFKHNDMNHLAKVLEENRKNFGGCLILSEGLFSMDGTTGDLRGISDLAEKYNARTFIDQGHCIGVLGKKGMGTSEITNTTDKIDLIMGLFSKGIGTLGGFVAGKKSVMNWLRAYSRAYVFGTSFPPAIAGASLESLKIIKESSHLREKLLANVKHFVRTINKNGIVIDPSHETPIIPIHVGDENKMGSIFSTMLADGVFALPVVFPVVSRSRCRFRFSITALHTTSDLDYAAMVFERAANRSGINLVEAAASLRSNKPNAA